MACTVQDIRDRFPEFLDDTEYTDSRIQLFIDDAECDLGEGSNWCSQCKFDRANCYYVAHLLTLGTGTEAGDAKAKVGTNKSKAAGGVSVTRGSVDKSRSNGDDLLATTAYGLQFMAIRDACFVGVTVANCL